MIGQIKNGCKTNFPFFSCYFRLVPTDSAVMSHKICDSSEKGLELAQIQKNKLEISYGYRIIGSI
jgi:hypothetical protein